jgi:photosystem II stability/assembly factor-like uncharacterized protein
MFLNDVPELFRIRQKLFHNFNCMDTKEKIILLNKINFLILIAGILTSHSVVKITEINVGIDLGTPALFFPSPTVGYAVGNLGVIAKTQDGGNTWLKIKDPNDTALYGVHFLDNQTGFAVGSYRAVIKSLDGGISWSRIPTDCGEYFYPEEAFMSVSFFNDKVGHILGERGTLLRTEDGGNNWACQDLRVRAAGDVYFTSATTGFVACDSGKVLKTKDGAKSWKVTYGPTEKWLFGISFFEDKHGYAVGERGAILKTADGGESWVSQSGTEQYLNDVVCLNSDTVFAVGDGGRMLYTTNGGKFWKEEVSPRGGQFFSVILNGKNTALVGGQYGIMYRLTLSDDGMSIATNGFYPKSRLQLNLFRRGEFNYSINGRRSIKNY